MQPTVSSDVARKALARSRILFGVLMLVVGIFMTRLFYLQVIRADYYHKVALSDQLTHYQIPAARGLIEAHQGNSIVPIVLNQTLYTVYADPALIKNVDHVADTLASVLGGNSATYAQQLRTPNSRYVVIAHKVSEANKLTLLKPKYPGLGAQAQDYRTYPDGALASQLLGFVDNSSTGRYGIEQALEGTLAGTPGQLKAVTDINGVPLAADTGNTLTPPVNGSNVVLTIDTGIQEQTEEILAAGVQNVKAPSGSAVIIDPNTGAIKAMANYPAYDPSNYGSVTDSNLFKNAAVATPIEVGSIMKTLTVSAGLDQGVIQQNTSYYDPASWTVDGYKITNIEQDGGPGQQNLATILNLSLNTGATWILMQMGGSAAANKIDQKGRDAWYDYMVNHYQLGKKTGIEQGYEASGLIQKPNDNGAGIDLTYANSAFGQAMTATPLQMAGAVASVLNGGTYYQPHLVDQTIAPNGKVAVNAPKAVVKNVVAPKVAPELESLMEYVVKQHALNASNLRFSPDYIVGGKTGTAQIAQPGGGYSKTSFNGTYVGFVGGNNVQYVIVVFVMQPQLPGYQYAGTAAAQPIFAGLAHMLINGGYASPKT